MGLSVKCTCVTSKKVSDEPTSQGSKGGDLLLRDSSGGGTARARCSPGTDWSQWRMRMTSAICGGVFQTQNPGYGPAHYATPISFSFLHTRHKSGEDVRYWHCLRTFLLATRKQADHPDPQISTHVHLPIAISKA